jgi:hypothetical protein
MLCQVLSELFGFYRLFSRQRNAPGRYGQWGRRGREPSEQRRTDSVARGFEFWHVFLLFFSSPIMTIIKTLPFKNTNNKNEGILFFLILLLTLKFSKIFT